MTKGETLSDTARTIEAMAPDLIVIRHASSGAPHQLARICRAGIINAGDGTHEHPTQALLDAFTIKERKGRLEPACASPSSATWNTAACCDRTSSC